MSYLLIISFLTSFAYPYTAFNARSRNSRFLIAQAAYLNNDLFRAEKLFKKLISEKVIDTNTFNSMDRLVYIAERHGDRKLFKDILDSFKKLKESSNIAYSSLSYTIGKHLLHSKEYNRAIKILRKIDKKSPYYPKALYLRATCLGVKKQYKNALILFDKIITMKNDFANQEIKDVATLGKARMFMLTKRYDDALVEYQSISYLSPYYLDALKEQCMVFFYKKEYDLALAHLESLILVNKKLYLPISAIDIQEGSTLTEFDLLKLKSMQGYIYMEQNGFEEALQIFDEIILKYSRIKKIFLEDLDKFKLSDDLTQLISHPAYKGRPRSLLTNIKYTIFDTNENYSKAFREWLSPREQREFIRVFSLYFSLINEANSIKARSKVKPVSEEERKIVVHRNVMNRYLKNYVKLIIKQTHSRLDDIGLKAQLGKIDIVWKTKENQSKKIKETQQQKQKYMRDIEKKYKSVVE